ncbi:translocation protein TolB [Aquisphaera giovannonii]|uniref:Translocation protein TolB n=1 Tax=Aquisphaera giovannonii TaxID=406548 RepID=A0A5B9W0L7_9BACT|nr:DUF1559 domain-containing protein [Aquisphaera giovannonii]QEH34108.1 translocation protein TolB [Aquisphaera giovannonii]
MKRRHGRGITLVEVLVMMGLLAVAALLMGPAMQAARAAARRASCISNLRAMGLALHNYASANNVYPPSDIRGEGRGVGGGFLLRLTPYMEQAAVYNLYNFSLEPWDATNVTSVEARLEGFLCPDNPRADNVAASELNVPVADAKATFGPAHYAANWGGGRDRWGRDFATGQGTYLGVMMTLISPDGEVKAPDGKARARCVGMADILDGTANTLAVAEKEESLGWAVGGFAASEFDVNTKPKNDEDTTLARRVYTGSPHREGIHAAFCDGSVRRVGEGINGSTWYAMMTRARGEIIPDHAAGLSSPLAAGDQTAETLERPRLAARAAEDLVKRLIAKPAGDPGEVGANTLSVRVVDLQTGEAARIIAPLSKERNACRFPAWSADGRHIDFCASGKDRMADVHVFDLSLRGGEVRLLDLGPGLMPSRSPSGGRILFQIAPGSRESPGIWMMRPDGGGRRRLGGEGRPRWSPDGHQFLIFPDEGGTFTLIDDRPDRWSGEVRVEGRSVTSVPSWAEPETIVAPLGDGAAGSGADSIALIEVSSAGKAAVRTILWKKGDGMDATPWSPVYHPGTGRCVFVGAGAGGGSGLYLLDRASPKPSRLEKAGQVPIGMTPSLSPDGRFVIFANMDQP